MVECGYFSLGKSEHGGELHKSHKNVSQMDLILCNMLVPQNDNLTITLYKKSMQCTYVYINIHKYIFQLNTKETRRTLNTNEKEKRQ